MNKPKQPQRAVLFRRHHYFAAAAMVCTCLAVSYLFADMDLLMQETQTGETVYSMTLESANNNNTLRSKQTANKCALHITSNLSDVPCYHPKQQENIQKCLCHNAKHKDHIPSLAFLAPPFGSQTHKTNIPLTKQQLRDDVIFAFIHVNKAGGTTIKRAILFRAIEANGWDGAAFGTPAGWTGLGSAWPPPRSCPPSSLRRNGSHEHQGPAETRNLQRSVSAFPLHHRNPKLLHRKNNSEAAPFDIHFSSSRTLVGSQFTRLNPMLRSLKHRGMSSIRSNFAVKTIKRKNMVGRVRRQEEPKYFRCGEAVANRDIQLPFFKMHRCPLRVIWGGNSMGLCQHVPGRPCIYLTILRHPVQRLVSQYNYVCVNGMEGRKDWTPEWRRKGRCDIGILDFVEHTNITSKYFLHERLTRSCGGSACDTDVARANLRNPCLRYLLLDKLEDGLARLKGLLGESLAPFFGELLDQRSVMYSNSNRAIRGSDVSKSDVSESDVSESDVSESDVSESDVSESDVSKSDVSESDMSKRRRATGSASFQRNRTPYAKRTMDILNNADLMARLSHKLKYDVALYEDAVEEYEAQWTHPLVSCNPL